MATKRQLVAWRLWEDGRTDRRIAQWRRVGVAVHPWLYAGFAAFISRRRMGGAEGLLRHVLLSVPAFALVWLFWAIGFSWRKAR